MFLNLKALQPNPFRDFAVDPIDGPENDNPELGYVSAITKLKESIEEDGFWGGVVVRRQNGAYQIAAGHHRVEAAIAAGLEEADLVVLPMDDKAMIRVYARENATQRGQQSTALLGSIASAVAFVAKEAFSEWAAEISSPKRGGNQGIRDVGRPAIMELLGKVPGITRNSVAEQLANLKVSGHYARIIKEVEDRIAEENRLAQEKAERLRAEADEIERQRKAAEAQRKKDEEERRKLDEKIRAAEEEDAKSKLEEDRKRAEERAERIRARNALREKRQAELAEERKKFQPKVEATEKAAEKAHKAAEKAAEKDPTFDYDGVVKWLHNDNQIRAFRKWATGPGIVPYLPVESQHLIAKELAVKAAKAGVELSAAFINREASNLLLCAKDVEQKNERKAQADLERHDLDSKARHWLQDFARHCRGMTAAGIELQAINRKWPAGTPFPITQGFRTALEDAKNVIDQLHKEII